MLHLAKEIDEAATAVRKHWPRVPRVGIILGSGLGGLADEIDAEAIVDYNSIPNFPQSTVIGHSGRLVCGTLTGIPVVAMQGRFHLYEGYSAAQVTLPVRVMRSLGIELLIVSNASGGLNPAYQSGEIMIIEDHMNFMFRNPLIGINDEGLGPRFPDMSRPYDPELIQCARAIARQNDFVAHVGVYVAMSGPTYETRAEYRYLRHIGGDVVGMSTVPEVIVAAHAGLRVVALSMVTNMCLPDALGETSGEDVVNIAAAAEPNLRAIVMGIVGNQ